MLNEQDHGRINAAIVEAERKTDADLFCLLSREVSSYREVPIAAGALAALVVPLLIVTLLPSGTLTSLSADWAASADEAVERGILFAVSTYAAAQVVLFGLVMLLVWLAPVRRVLTPGFLKTRRVRQAAQAQYASAALHLPPNRPHVLIFVAVDDRHVEIIAGDEAHRSAGDGVWQQAAGAITDGMRRGREADGIVRAIALMGDALTRDFPRRAGVDTRSTESIADV